MDVDYKKDLHHNYMVLSEIENSRAEPYCIKMLSIVQIEGLLPAERRTIDNLVLFYYDISGKQSISNLFDKATLSCHRVKQLILHIIFTIEKTYEYLLVEDDFVLTPEFVYMDVKTDAPYLCYLQGYQKDVKNQISSFIEYLMNKVDYNDKEAVLLIYSLYALSKEEGFTFDHLQDVLLKQNDVVQTPKRKGLEEDSAQEMQIGETGKGKEQKEEVKPIKRPIIPIMMEKLVGEEEVSCFPIKTYLYTAACILGGVLVLVLGILTKIIYNSFGNRIDYSKLFALLLLILCVIGYLLRKIWDKKNQITKIVMKQEYIDPRIENENEKENLQPSYQDERINTTNANKSEEIGDDNPTCILNEALNTPSFVLKPLDTAKYNSILITQFPFFIGKLKKNVDYCLEKDVVSRYHAKITMEQEGYYITDLNSTNGTYLNKEELQTYQKKEIKPGDEIAFANIKFLFLLQDD